MLSLDNSLSKQANRFTSDTTATATKCIETKDTKSTKHRKKSLKFGHQIINPVAEASRETAKGVGTVRSSSQAATTRTEQIQR